NAGNGATRSAAFFRQVFALPLFLGVFGERDAGVPALLRAIVDQAILANIEVTRPRAAAPVILSPCRDIVLKTVHARERPFSQRHDLLKNFLLPRAQRL